MTPQKFGRYEMQSEIGRGGMATVFKAYDPRFERIVAIKVLPREFLHEPEFLARFNREAKTIAALEHPAIVPVYDYGDENGQPYLVMRYMPGGSLAERLQQGPIPVEEAAVILQRLGSALDRAHRQGIIHRDMKPSNILFDQYGEAFLADFGIVHVTSSSAALTASGSLVGTPTYMSPEQVYGDKELDGRSDIYALGVILFQMLTGHLPYEADTPAKMMMKHVMEPVPNVLSIRPDLPPLCDEIITRAMAKERDARFPTAKELSAALTAATQKTPQSDVAAELAAVQSELISSLPSTEEQQASQAAITPPLTPPPVAPPTPARPETPVVFPQPEGVAERRQASRVPVWIWGALALLVFVCLATIGVLSWLVRSNEFAFLAGRATATEVVAVVTEAVPEATATVAATGSVDTTAAAQTAVALAGTETAAAPTATTEPEGEATNTPAADSTAVEATRQSAIAARETLAAAATATAEATAALASTVRPIFGPQDGSLTHNSDDFLESAYANVNVSNFVVQATVGNPFAATSGPWDIGLLFRQTEPDQEFRLVVSSDGSWNLNNRQGSEDSFISEGQITSSFNTDENGLNKITLLAQDNRGYFFLNDEFVALLDLSGRVNLGDIGLGTGFYVGNEREGAATTYQGYSVWPLAPEFGPRSGELAHADDGLIESHSADVEQVNIMADALFYNPYSSEDGAWDVGFAFRETEIEDQFWLIVESSSEWSLIDRQHGDDVFLDDGLIENWDAAAGGSNRLTLIALGDHGYFFANNTFVAPLDLSDRANVGDVEIATGYYIGDEIDGEVTRYEEFAVWPLP